jgi:hypothetical protein
MGKTCFACEGNIGWGAISGKGIEVKQGMIDMNYSSELFGRMNDDDVICGDCMHKESMIYAVEICEYWKKVKPEILKNLKDLVVEAERITNEKLEKEEKEEKRKWYKENKSKMGKNNQNSSNENIMPPFTKKNISSTSVKDLNLLLITKHDKTKEQWDKNGIVQFKDEAIAILQRKWGSQVQFIIACSQLTKEGYRLMAIDEGKEGSSGGFSGGVNAYFYFQKMDFVR